MRASATACPVVADALARMSARSHSVTPGRSADWPGGCAGRRACGIFVVEFFALHVPAQRVHRGRAAHKTTAAFLRKPAAKKSPRARELVRDGARKSRRDARAKRDFEFVECVFEVLHAKKDC